jgi:hypothetical protein
MELLYGGEGAGFSSLRAKDTQSAILNLEQGKPVPRWGRLIFHVTDVDALWNHLKDRGFDPEIPRDASWGERYLRSRRRGGVVWEAFTMHVRPQRHQLSAVPLLRVTLLEAHASFLRRLCVRCREWYRDTGEMFS